MGNGYQKLSTRSNFLGEGWQGREGRVGRESRVQFTDFGTVRDNSFKEWRQKTDGLIITIF